MPNQQEPYHPPPGGFRTFIIVWITQSLSVMGTAVAWFALTVWLTQQTESQEDLGAKLGIMGVVGFIPTVIFAPIAGAWADRHDRKQTMLIVNGISAVVSLAGALLLYTGQLHFPLLVSLAFMYPALGAFHNAAFDTSYAMLVRDAQLPRANAMMQTVQSLAFIIAPGTAALLIALPLGATGALLVDGITFLLAALALIFLTIPSPQRTDLVGATGHKKSFWTDVSDGGLFIWARRPMLWLLATFSVSNFAWAGMAILLPVVVRYRLAENAATHGLDFPVALATVQTMAGVGGVSGGLLLSVWGGLQTRRALGVVVPILCSGLLQIAFGLTTMLYGAVVALFLYTSLTPIMNSHSQAIWQSQTPRDMQGRVFAVRRLIAWVFNPVSTALMGVLTARGFDAHTIIVTLGSVTVVWCVVNLFNTNLLRIDEKGFLEAYAARHSGGAKVEM